MGKSKRISFTSIAIVVLAILLTVSLTMGGTLAWFANQNQAGTNLTMGNAVGVAVVDGGTSGNGSMDKLSFTFHTGRNGELMLPGTQVDPNVYALIAKSNTNTILRAVVTFEVTVKDSLIDKTGGAGNYKLKGTEYKVSDDGFMSVPSNVTGSATGDDAQRELWVLNQMYTSFFTSLQSSALYNGWVYRESNVGIEFGEGGAISNANGKVFKGSAQPASTKYYIAGATQYSNQPLAISRTAGPGLTQAQSGTYTPDDQVLYNAFYFRGWKGAGKTTTLPQTGPVTVSVAYEGSTTIQVSGTTATVPLGATGWFSEDRGIDGYYVVRYSNGSRTQEERYIVDTGVQYYATRAEAYAGTGVTGLTPTADGITEEYQILEGKYSAETGKFAKTADPLGFRKGDATDGKPEGNDAAADSLGKLNVASADVNKPGGASTIGPYDKSKYGWMTAGVQKASEDMMCVINTLNALKTIPLFTTSFVLPTTWTQDVFADRSMRLNLTFQVMQADYLASGTSHHVSVELAESRFDDVTVWADADDTGYTAGQPYVKDVNGQPNFNDPEFWPDDYKNEMTPTEPEEPDESEEPVGP